MTELSRSRYALLYGPTAGDRVRLADTDLFIEVEQDLCAGGDEAVFGGGKVIRESMGQSRATRADGAPDLVITGAVVLDHWGIIKADVGIRDGRIVALGKAGNPDIMDGVHPDLVIGPSTEIMAGNGLILTAGGIDCHVHLICPQLMPEAIGSGVTTVIGGGTGPAEGTKATTVTPGAWHLARMLEATDGWPLNVVLLGKGNTVSEEALWEQLRAGASGFKLHEDWGSTPAAIDACLRVCQEAGVQAALHTDTLNEAGFVEDTLAAIAGRPIHAYHTEGAGGGHAPDIITVAGPAEHPAVLDQPDPAAHGQHGGRAPRHADGVPPPQPGRAGGPGLRGEPDPALDDRRRGHPARHGRDLHDRLGLPGHGAHRRGHHPDLADRARDEAAARGRSRRRRGGQPAGPPVRGQVHDLPGHRARPGRRDRLGRDRASSLIWCCGSRRSSASGRTRCSRAASSRGRRWATRTPRFPRRSRCSPGRCGARLRRRRPSTSVSFVSELALENGLAERLGLARALVPVADVSGRGKADMINNDALPDIRVEPDTFTVRIDGEVIEEAPAAELPMAQRYFLF